MTRIIVMLLGWVVASALICAGHSQGGTILRSRPGGAKNCTYLKLTYEGKEEVPGHTYRLLEECLYYKLRDRATKNLGRDVINTEPPYGRDGNIHIVLHNASLYDIRVHGSSGLTSYQQVMVKMSWIDRRWAWQKKASELNSFRVRYSSNIWIPQEDMFLSGMARVNMQRANRLSEVTFQNIQIAQDGNVTALGYISVSGSSYCEADPENFPDHTLECWYKITSRLYGKELRYTILDPNLSVMDSVKVGQWKIQSYTVSMEQYPDNEGEYLKFRLLANHVSHAKRIELTLPMVLSVVLVLVSFLFGSFKLQIGVKLFALVFQFLSFQMLVRISPDFGAADSVPTVYKFYEGTMITTMISLVMSLIINSLVQAKFKLPAPHSLILVSQTINRLFICGVQPSANIEQRDGVPLGDAATSVSPAWKDVWLAVNNAVSVVFIVFYVIVIIAIYS